MDQTQTKRYLHANKARVDIEIEKKEKKNLSIFVDYYQSSNDIFCVLLNQSPSR